MVSDTKRAGNNIIDSNGTIFGWSDRILLQDFDNPSSPDNNLPLSSSTPLNLEYLIAAPEEIGDNGDSGGGLFIESGGTQLVGIHSFMNAPDGTFDSDYGDIAASADISAFSGWISDNTQSVVPEPASFAFLLGLIVVAFVKLKKS